MCNVKTDDQSSAVFFFTYNKFVEIGKLIHNLSGWIQYCRRHDGVQV